MKTAVVGSKGFIGARLVRALRDAGHEVVELDLPRIDISEPCADAEYCEMLRGTEVLYHLAVMNLEHCRRDPCGAIDVNVRGTLNVMELAKAAGVRRVVYSSASSVYGNSVKQPVPEDAPTDPLTLYGATKLAAEKIVQLYGNDGLVTVIFRFSNVYGPRQVNGIIPTVIDKIRDGAEIEVTGNGTQTRDFVYVDDVVGVLVRAIRVPLYNIVCNIGSGKPESVNSVIETISRLLMRKPVVRYVPMQVDRNVYCADITKMRALYNPEFLSFEHGLLATINGKLKAGR